MPRVARHRLTQEQYGVLFAHLRRGDALEILQGEQGFAGPILDQALREGDTIEGYLVREKQPLLVALVRRIGHPRTPMDWEDLLQESRLRLVLALRVLSRQDVRPDGNVEGYLYHAVVNGLRNHHRRTREQRRTISANLVFGDEDMGGVDGVERHGSHGSDDPCAGLERQALWDELRQVVGTDGAVLLWQEHVEELPQAESAMQLGVTTRTVRNRLDRARRKLRGNRRFCQDYEGT